MEVNGSLIRPGFRAGAGLRERRGAAGQVILEAVRQRKTAATPRHVPFDVVKYDSTTVRVYPGVISGGETEIVPSGFSTGDDPPFYLAITSTGYVYIPIVMTFDSSYMSWKVTSAGAPRVVASVPSETSEAYSFTLGSVLMPAHGDISVVSYQRGSGTVTRSGTDTDYVSAFYQ